MARSKIDRGRPGVEVRLMVLLGLFVVVLTACGDPTKSEEYTSLESEYAALEAELGAMVTERDSVTARLGDTESNLATSTQMLVVVEASLTDRETEVAELHSMVDEMLASLETIRRAAAAHASGDLILNMRGYEDAVANGISVEVGDQLVADLALPGGTWVGFLADDDTYWCWCQSVNDIGDPEISAALNRWVGTPAGSDEEFWAWYEVQLRILGAILVEVDSVTSEATSTLQAKSS